MQSNEALSPIHKFARLLPVLLLFTSSLTAQLVPAGAPIPKGPNPPVVFLNGYQDSCSGSSFAGTFGAFDQILQRNNRATVFFDNCLFPNRPFIEDLGNSFATFLAALKYQDGTPVTQVDVVAHSLGGLIVRSYLAGKQTNGTYTPPATVLIRKYISIAVPNFGTVNPAVTLVVDNQTTELAAGSRFTFDLGTWNQGTDDLRGVDALAIVGNGGTGQDTMPGFDDGLVSLSSGSIGFARPNRTRIINACHTGPGILSTFNYCPLNAPAVAAPNTDTDLNAAIAVSFLANTTAWQSLGQAAEQNMFLSVGGGLELRAKSAADVYLPIDSAKVAKSLNLKNNTVAYTEYLTPVTQQLTVASGSTTIQTPLVIQPGFGNAVTVKNGPQILRVLPSAAAVFPLNLAPNSYISIYGTGFTPDTTVKTGAQSLQLVAVTPNQINAILPGLPSGLVPLTVANASGQHTVNVLTFGAVPTLFTQDGSGAGAASALNAVTNALVTPNAPLRAGDYVSLYLTGLTQFDPTTANPVSVTIAGQSCPVQYAGVAPGYTALDQVNCQIPTGIPPTSAAPVIVTALGLASNTVTLALQ
jgi:uncharacterized protein (TIGR03437 family)